MGLNSVLIVAAIQLLFIVSHAEPIKLWPTEVVGELEQRIRDFARTSDRANARLAQVKHAHFFSAENRLLDLLEENREVEFGIPLFEGGLEKRRCTLRKGHPIVPSALARKVPELKLFHCLTEKKGELSIVFDSSRIDGLSASFFDAKNRRTYYVDNIVKGSSNYIIYDSEIAGKEGNVPEFEDTVERFFIDPKFKFDNRALQESEFPAFKFKLAPLANAQYSLFHGNTIPSVLAAIIECFSRVNGVYSREMGVFLVLIEDAELGICLSGDERPACARIGNDSSVIRVSMGILTDLNVDSDSYDIGHVLTTGSGGVAFLGSLCSRSNKAGGTTGLPQPFTDVYYVDYVAHEIGHQLLGGHVFRDCAGRFDGNLMETSAAEPGSGSSIMGYAGICGSNNIQGFSDPYFNNVNLQQMRDFVFQTGNNGCGEKILVTNTIPELEVTPVCTIPLSSNFQINGRSLNQPEDETSFFSWDRSDLGFEDFSSDSLGKFRSWKPTTSTSRFFPNLYALNYPSNYLSTIEMLPTEAREMNFRFTERRLYDTSAVAESFESSIMGDFSYADITVQFTPASPIDLVVDETLLEVDAGETITLEWNGNSGSSMPIEVLVAENILEETEEEFDYERDVKELSWQLVGSSTMGEGSISVDIPVSLNGTEVMVMVRSSFVEDIESCFFFDLITGIQVSNTIVNNENDQTENGEDDDTSSVTVAFFILVLVLIALALIILSFWTWKQAKKSSTVVAQPKITPEEELSTPPGASGTVNPMMGGVQDNDNLEYKV